MATKKRHTAFSIHTVPSHLDKLGALRQAHQRLFRQLGSTSPMRTGQLKKLLGSDSVLLVALNHKPSRPADWGSIEASSYVGTLTLSIAITATKTVGRIEHVVVDENYRGVGVGKALVTHALQISADKGLDRVDLTSGSSKAVAQGMYKSLGFYKRDTVNWRYDVGRY